LKQAAPEGIRVEPLREATPEFVAAASRLLPQLNPRLGVPPLEQLQRMVDDPGVTLLVAREGEAIVGMACVIVYSTPARTKARLEDVVVDERARGRGVGAMLVEACIELGRKNRVNLVELQSARIPAREAAHRLYQRLGFKLAESDVFRLELG
jgi:GNAT superfamily N-acetyltransferase